MPLTSTRTFTTCVHDGEKTVPIPSLEWCKVCGAYRRVVQHGPNNASYGQWVEPEGPDGKGVKFF